MSELCFHRLVDEEVGLDGVAIRRIKCEFLVCIQWRLRSYCVVRVTLWNVEFVRREWEVGDRHE